jgi:circadian clock protein KaiB
MKILKKPMVSRAKQTATKVSTTKAKDKYVMRLFVAGASARSRQAVLRVRELFEMTPKGRVKLEVVDIFQQPGLARDFQIVATPTLIIQLPLPVRRFIGSLTNFTDLFSLMDMSV